MESKNPIQVADKLFLVLETLAKTGPIGLSDLCREVSLNKTTVHRLLNSLLYMGYVRQDTQTSRYSLSFKIWDIANQFVSKIDIVEEARPSLRELAAKTGETVHLVQIDGIHAIYIAKEESENSVRLVSMVGKRIPLYCSGVGKALLADMSNDEIKSIWDKSDKTPLTEHTITDFSKFMQEIEETRKRGYAMDNEEELNGVICVGAPIFNYTGYPCGSIWISGPKDRLTEEQLRSTVQIVKEIAGQISAELGYRRV